MIDNPLVEAVAEAIAEQDYDSEDAEYYKRFATAALRAIEDAGWKVVKKEEG